MAEVHIRDGETLESALRRFKRKVQEEDIIKEIKRRSYYLKPGEKKRIKAELARRRTRKKRRYRQVFVIQLREAEKEWRRRLPGA